MGDIFRRKEVPSCIPHHQRTSWKPPPPSLRRCFSLGDLQQL